MTTLEFTKNLLGLQPGYQRFAWEVTTDCGGRPEYEGDSFLNGASLKDKFVDFTNLNIWGYKVKQNRIVDNYRSNGGGYSHANPEFTQIFRSNLQGMGFDSDGQDYDIEDIEKVVDSLNKEFRIPFRMYLNGLKYSEIADLLGLNVNTVKCRIFFTRKKVLLLLKNNIR